MTTPPMDVPVTEAGRRLLEQYPTLDGLSTSFRDAILAIEAEAATAARSDEIDVEALAEAWANVMDGRRIGSGLDAARIGRATTTSDDWHAIATEYARLRSEQGERAPRVDPEIDAT